MRKWILMIGTVVAVLILVVAGIGYFGSKALLQRSLPQTSGEIVLDDLQQDVEIIRDTYGVPHIYAQNEHDLYFAFGFVMAQDRFWQMEFYRRLGAGRLSEIFGKDYVKADRYFRMLKAAGTKKEVPGDLGVLLTSFTNGINAYIATHRDRMPLEFRLLDYRPEPWGINDHLDVLRVINWGLSMGWQVDLTAAAILEKVGADKFKEAFPIWPEDAPLIIPQGSTFSSGISKPTLETIRFVERLGVLSVAGASNSWAVSPKKSVTGKPLLANDPHLGLTNPSFWWEVHLVDPSVDVTGVALPGTPGITIGHNHHVAWGLTTAMADDMDFYIEKINPKNPRQYLYKGHWEEMKVVKEVIRVKNEEPVETEIHLTRHGPIVSEIEKGLPGKAISARWAYPEVIQAAQAVYLLAKAKDIGDVKEALKHWLMPGQNIVFADSTGDIGYWCCAAIPIRSGDNGILPLPGWTGDYEWNGYVPFEERPHVINPEEGFIATANNKVVDTTYPYLIGHYWEPMDRITRIREMLSSKDRLSVEDFKRMQQDVDSMLARELTPKIIRTLRTRLAGEEGQKVKDILSQWDLRMDKDSVGACLFEVTYRKMMENIFKDELGERLFQDYVKTSVFAPRAMRIMIRKESSVWIDDVNTPEKESFDDLMAESLTQMLAALKGLLGENMARWTWGRIHSVTFEHVLGKKKPLNWIFNLGPFALGGSHLTVSKGRYPYEKPYRANHGVSHRMIVDLSDVNRSIRVIPTGQSGHRFSRHHQDQIDLYLKGEYHPDWTSREKVESHAEQVLILRSERKG